MKRNRKQKTQWRSSKWFLVDAASSFKWAFWKWGCWKFYRIEMNKGSIYECISMSIMSSTMYWFFLKRNVRTHHTHIYINRPVGNGNEPRWANLMSRLQKTSLHFLKKLSVMYSSIKGAYTNFWRTNMKITNIILSITLPYFEIFVLLIKTWLLPKP